MADEPTSLDDLEASLGTAHPTEETPKSKLTKTHLAQTPQPEQVSPTLELLSRLEPNITIGDGPLVLTSIAVSAKRIAAALERMAEDIDRIEQKVPGQVNE